jgi:sporulation protein YlmC with PRC-barrel domain
MKFSDLRSRAVVTLEEAKKTGEVQEILVEPDSDQIVSFRVETDSLGRAKLVPVADARKVVAGTVMISVKLVQ